MALAPISYFVLIKNEETGQYEDAFDGRAWVVPGVGEILVDEDRVYRVDSRRFLRSSAHGQYGDDMEGDIAAVELRCSALEPLEPFGAAQPDRPSDPPPPALSNDD